jgi:DNA-binding response OmpR family regulator
MKMKHILIVDDEPHVIRIMKLALEKAGYSIDEAANGQQAVDRLQETLPDVIITDVDMPRMTGKELCMHIQETLPDRTFKILVLTSRAEDEHRVWSSAIDNLDFIEKPVSIRKLVARLDEHFANTAVDEVPACQQAR